jgi:hypothetical protein
MQRKKDSPFTKTQLDYLNKRITTCVGIKGMINSFDKRIEEVMLINQMLINENKTLKKKMEYLEIRFTRYIQRSKVRGINK